MYIGYAISVIVVSFILSLILTWRLIPFMHKKQMGQNIREEGPKSHQSKAGTPSMGGIAIVIAVVVGGLIGEISMEALFIASGFVLFGLLGFLDDYLKVIKKQNEGLTAPQKFGIQFALSLAFACALAFAGPGTEVYIPFAGFYADFGLWYIPFIVFVILAMVNAANLTDGLDGLAAGTTAIVAVTLSIVAGGLLYVASESFLLATAGSCAGFMVFNKFPAKIFMGDTGSLALGGGITIAAIVMKMEFLLPLVGLVYVLEALSVCIQVAVFKATKDESGEGRRVFIMTPLHHHFQESGMRETRVVGMFWGFTLICCILTMVLA